MKNVILNGTNSSMPAIGLGTWQAKPDELEIAVTMALNAGYRHIDTAFNYNNEETLGKVLKSWMVESKVERSELFITTKLPHIGNRAEDVEKFLKLSLKRLQLDYVDLYLIHVPFGFMCDPKNLVQMTDENGNVILDLTTDHISLWRAMESVVDQGLVKNIGLSNFNEKQIENIYVKARIKPNVLQIECHPYHQQNTLREYCKTRNITVTAYSPLGSPGAKHHFMSKYNYELKNCYNILEHPTILSIANEHKKSSSQIVLHYLLQNNITVIPKSSNPGRVTENINIFDFELNNEEMNSLKQLDKGVEGRIIDFHFWNGCEKHPQYPF